MKQTTRSARRIVPSDDSATAAPASPPAAQETLRAALRISLLGLLLLSPLPFGSVQPWSVLVIEIWAAITGAGALWLLFRDAERPTRLARQCAAVVAALVAIGLLQLVPLPVAWVSRLAAPTAAARAAVAEMLPEVANGAAPLSLSPPDTVDAVLRLIAYVLIGLTAAVALRQPRQLRLVALAVLVSGTFQALYGSFEFLSGRQHIFGYAKKYYLTAATGTFINRNHFAGYLAMTLPMALGLLALPLRGGGHPRHSWREKALLLSRADVQTRLFAAFGAFCIWVGVLLSSSRAGLAAGLVATLLAGLTLAKIRRRTVVVVAAAVAVPTLFLLYQDVNSPGERMASLAQDLAPGAGRPTVWLTTLRIVADYPLLGSGLGTFETAFPAYRPPILRGHWDHAHNDWLQSAAAGGLLVPLMLAVLCYLLLRPPARRGTIRSELLALSGGASAGIAAIAFHSTVDFCLRIPAIPVLLAGLVGLRIASDRLSGEEPESGPRPAGATGREREHADRIGANSARRSFPDEPYSSEFRTKRCEHRPVIDKRPGLGDEPPSRPADGEGRPKTLPASSAAWSRHARSSTDES